MAEQLAHDVVKSAQSMGGATPSIDDIATSSIQISADAYVAKSTSPSSFTSDISGLKSSGHGEEGLQTPVTETVLPIREFSKSPLGDKSLLAETSGGSDTDTSKPDVFGQKDGGAGHNRSNSVKKPTSFKSVSVTKNFLAKAAVGTPTSRVVEKVPSGQPSPVSALSASAKPRLVAKSALGGLTTRSGLGGAGAGPDPNTVWNRNKPAPTPVPRQFTDEELKQHYGIHMAARLPADETGKESKWADIDDDEDDWATPEIKWMDGTTSTITISQPDSNQLFTEEKDTSTEVLQPILMESTPMLSTPKSMLSGNRTILKPGGHSSAHSKGLSGANLKGGSDKTGSLSSQGPVTKSPWAALPPVEKASPIQFSPVMQPPPRFARDPSGFEGFVNTAQSPKEIAADDFNRVWNNDAPRAKELYIPHSGRFESVNDNRRYSNRGDPNRQPAVLQRPPHQAGPAEPSAAFQTHRSGGPEGQQQQHWQRHRTGSMSSTGRRMSLSRSSDQQSDRFDMSASSPRREMAQPHGQRPWTRTSPTLSFVQPVMQDQEDVPISPAPSSPIVQPEQTESTEDPVAVQQRLMREKIERAKAAKQRQIEEEQREERAKQERLKAKIDALGGTGPSPSAEAKEARLKPQYSPVTKSTQANTSHIASPPKPPVPTAEGEVAQYGMMKVHQPHPVRRHIISEGSLMNRQPSDADRRQTAAEANQQKFGPNGRIPVAGEKNQKSSPDNRRDDSILWRVSELPDTLSGWSVSNSSNVWAPPQSKDRALGNGTFDSAAYPRPAPGALNSGPRPMGHVTSAPTSNGPGPIARPMSSNVPGQSNVRNQQSVNQSTDEKSQAYLDSQPPIIRPQQSGEMANRLMNSNAPSRYAQFNSATDSSSNIGNWTNYREQITSQDAAADKRGLELMEEARRNPKSRTFHETYYDRRSGEKLGESVIVNVAKNVYVEGRQNANPNGPTQSSGQTGFHRSTNFAVASPQSNTNASRTSEKASATQSKTSSMSQAANVSASRSSRFFPRGDAAQSSETSESPPPPELSSLDSPRGIKSPVVNLPRPVVVKLPPARPSERRFMPPVSPTVGRTNSKTSDWQNKIDQLLRNGKTTDNMGLLSASSRAPFDVTMSQFGATVSLPTASYKAFVFAKDESSTSFTRSLDNALFPQPEFGSTPTIQLPRMMHLNAALPLVFHRSPKHWREERGWEFSTAKSTFNVTDATEGPKSGDIQIIIRLGGHSETKLVPFHLPLRNLSRGSNRPYRARRGHTDAAQSERGGRRGSGQFGSREGPNPPTRGAHTVRGRPSRGSSFATRRNITAPATSTPVAN